MFFEILALVFAILAGVFETYEGIKCIRGKINLDRRIKVTAIITVCLSFFIVFRTVAIIISAVQGGDVIFKAIVGGLYIAWLVLKVITMNLLVQMKVNSK